AACGAAATPTTAPGVTQPPAPTSSPVFTLPTAIPSLAATATARPTTTVSAKDSITLVMNEEPLRMNPFPTQGGIAASPGKDNTQDPLAWRAADDLRAVPTSATESWKQVDPDTWQFKLRKGVKFHNGEPWNAQAAMPSFAYQGVGNNDNSSYSSTGGFKAAVVDEYTVDINCDQGCPIFPDTAFFLNFNAPNFMATATKEQLERNVHGLGPYKLVKWEPGVSLTQEAYADYVPGPSYEFQKPLIKNVKWQWRAETTVAAAMIQAGEADMAWDVGVDAIKSLKKEQMKSGGSAEVYIFWINTLWHPELKKVKVRQAMVAAINCKEIVDALYGGLTPCRGSTIWPGVTGATEANTKPYEYNPARAKQLLAEANYDPKNVIKLTGRAARIPKQQEVYEAVQAYLKEVGMNVEINVVEASVRSAMRNCAIGTAVNEVVAARGADPKTTQSTRADWQAALDKGGAKCPTSDIIETPISSETLDFGRNALYYLNCIRIQSFVCDPSPGGLQDQLGPALAASGAERQRLLAAMNDRAHNDVLFLPLFDLPVIYAVNPKLQYTPRFDRRVRVNTMWLKP
ncbi:MAG TPA: ABC transporter substrate-binding protein, partial [Dehalococcoidia bacterium]|nr:ABC transporter substrate-binding protein [Dehalococcoidia bacterium]